MRTEEHDRIPVAPQDYQPPPMDLPVRAHALPWEWWDAIGIYAAWLLLSSVAALAVGGIVDPESDAGLAVAIVVTLVILIAVTATWLHLRGRAAGVSDAVRRALGPKRITLGDVARGVGYGLAAFLIVQLGLGLAITSVLEALGRDLPVVQEEVQSAVQGTGASSLLVAVAVALLAPIGEEVLFRGVLYQALAKHLSGWPAIGLSGLAFGLVHLELFVVLLTFPLGMFLAWTVRRTGTVVVPIAAHAVFNLIGVIAIRAGAVGG
jgi:membrane protease YdiL (CAAX protease family)